MSELIVTIPARPPFYSLYADGFYTGKVFVKEAGETRLFYKEGEALVLYYTYPSYRTASVVRNAEGRAALPGLSKPVRLLCTVHASKTDKLRRAVSYLNAHGGAFAFSDGFYLRLSLLLQQRGTLNYSALGNLAAADKKKDF